MEHIEKNNISKLQNVLCSLPEGIQINDLVDKDGFTLLHMAAFKNKE
jgi:ankyrin repeat protein